MRLNIVFLITIQFISLSSFSKVTLQPDTLSPDGAIKYYKSILKKNKDSEFAYFGIASAYFMKNDYLSALKYSKHTIRKPNDFEADAYIIYASSLDRLGRSKEAFKEFEKAIKLYPENYQLSYQYALSCYKYRILDKALPAIERVIQLQPLFVPAHYLFGCCLFEKSNDKRCISAMLFALLLDKDSARSQQAIAFVSQYLNQRFDNIVIPYFDKRIAITTLDHILYSYFPKNVKGEIFSKMQPETIAGLIKNYLETQKQYLPAYDAFYKSLMNEHLTEIYSHYVLRTLNDSYQVKWLKANSDGLKLFASFLEKNLPGK